MVIGTHRLLSDDIAFKDLGLLVVDEEQRFGVSHKEAIKALRADVDVLTLTATPIPRTLEMSLTGIRDLTAAQHAAGRAPAHPHLRRRARRPGGGRGASAASCCARARSSSCTTACRTSRRWPPRLRGLVPEARIAVAHGQMDEGTLEQVVLDFWEGEYDVLVCTTIIESGIDMPTVNTLVVDRADLLGLGQLHQLRGRVGRAGSRAYAYLFYPPDRSLTEEAYERLKTIGEATELGSGFKIAMRDLEIRGAGNLLGTGQSGHIAAVGYDLYCQMVTEAVAELKGEQVREPAEIKLELPARRQPAAVVRGQGGAAARGLPSPGRGHHRGRGRRHPRRVGSTATGRCPPEAEALLEVARLRAECVRTGVREVTVTKGPGFGGPRYIARLTPVELPTSKVIRLQRLYKDTVYKEDQRHLQLPVASAAESATTVVAALRELIPPEDRGRRDVTGSPRGRSVG